MSTDFDQLAARKIEWDSLQPLQPDHERRLWKKLRLEWNYHSNHLEGNTLTYGETELLLLHGQAAGDHPLRDYEEMKAHDAAIEYVRQLAADRSRPLTEADVRDLNRIILKEPFWKAAQTLDGQPTRKQIVPGQYKTSPNNVRTVTGEIFEFASVEDTPPRVAALGAWLRETLTSATVHPIAIAAKFHHDFVLIHPFDDGNGRVARLITNYVLLRLGYPPIVVRSEDKPAYLTALRKADAGELESLTEFLASSLQWSLALAIRAAKGVSIDEPTDVEKEVALFIRDQQARKDGETPERQRRITEILDVSLKPFVEKVEAKLSRLAPLFRRTSVSTQDEPTSSSSGQRVAYANFKYLGPGKQIAIGFHFRGYQGSAPTAFDLDIAIRIEFTPDNYTIAHDGETILSSPYSKLVLGDEAEALSTRILAVAFSEIKDKAGQE